MYTKIRTLQKGPEIRVKNKMEAGVVKTKEWTGAGQKEWDKKTHLKT